jgi:hypothetical protein
MTVDNSIHSNAHPPSDSEPSATKLSGEEKNPSEPTKEQLDLRAFVKLLGELLSKGKITGQHFRENR